MQLAPVGGDDTHTKPESNFRICFERNSDGLVESTLTMLSYKIHNKSKTTKSKRVTLQNALLVYYHPKLLSSEINLSNQDVT